MSPLVRRPRTRAAVVGAVLAALASSSCGADGEPSTGGRTGGASDAAASSRAGSAPPASGSSSRELGTRPAAGDLANFSCSQARDGVWSARGDVTNSADEPMIYTVTVVTVDGGEVSGEETRRLVLEPDQAASFDLPTVARGAADACMPRLLRSPR